MEICLHIFINFFVDGNLWLALRTGYVTVGEIAFVFGERKPCDEDD